ncbi:MAG: CoA protein activase [Bacillota bacterium]
MILTYPHMGEAYIAAKAMFDDIGVESIIPAYTTKTTMQLGSKLSPESICLPFKIMLGNYIDAIKNGADTILITGSCGPCRFGYYGPIQKQILEEAGYKNVELIILDPPGENPGRFLKSVSKLTGGKPAMALKALRSAYKICCAIDDINEKIYHVRPRAVNKAEVRSIIHSFRSSITRTKGSAAILELIKSTMHLLDSVELVEHYEPLKIGIIGEIYTIIDPFSNLEAEEKLGELGVQVHRSMTVKDWAKNSIIRPMTGREPYKREKKLSKPYLPAMIGGHAQQCIAHAIQYAQAGYDGLIQIYPMTCMPEIVSRSILPQIEKDYNIPILYLIVDEQTGEAGYITRLEAFIDYVSGNKKKEAASC